MVYLFNNSSATPEEWESFSNKNVLKAESERNSSVTLRSMIDEILQETYDDQQKQCDNTNLSFEKRIEETEKAKAKLEDHLAKVSFHGFFWLRLTAWKGRHFQLLGLERFGLKLKFWGSLKMF